MKKLEGQDEAMQSGYTMPLPVLFLRDQRISPGAKTLMAYLTRYVNMRDRKVYPSQAALGRELNVSKRTVNRWVGELKKIGYVEIKEDGASAGRPNAHGLSWAPCVASETCDRAGADIPDGGDCASPVLPGCDENDAQETKTLETQEEQKHAGGAALVVQPEIGIDETPQDAHSGLQDMPPENTQIITTPPGSEIPAEPPDEDEVKEAVDCSLFEETMRSVHIPQNLREHYAGVHAALKQSVPNLVVPANRKAIQAVFDEVSGMLNEGLIDNRGPVGLLVHKVKNAFQAPSRDFKMDEFRFAYERSQKPTKEELEEISRYVKRFKATFERCMEQGGTLEMLTRRFENEMNQIEIWLILASYGSDMKDDFLSKAGLAWTFTSPDARAIYRAEFPDVDASPLEELRVRLLEDLGI